MPTVSKSALKARMLEYFREVESSGEPLVVTDNRVPVLKVLPFRRAETAEEIFGDLRKNARLPDDAELNEPVADVWSEHA